ncbi:hypothetical protein ACFL6X_02835 [Candidatus Latescibacterota bacterium]
MTVHLSDGEQLLLDDALLARRDNVRRRVVPAVKTGHPVLEADRPWENGVALFGTVLRDGDRCRMWYLGGGHVCYAESDDGMTWEKPELDVVKLAGKRTNVVIERGGFGHHYEIFGAVKDEADPDPARRYKMGYLSIDRDYRGPHEDPFHRGSRRGLGTAVSPDGYRWTMESEFASHGICDISRFYQHPDTGRFVLYGRTKLTEDRDRWRSWGWGRAVVRMESDDFRTWSDPEFVLGADEDDPEGSEIYSMPAFAYNGLHIGMVQMFYGLPDQGNLEIQLATSRDGLTFQRLEDRSAFLPEGEVGSWDRYNIALGCLPPVSVAEEWWFFYSGRTYRHGPYDGADTGPSSGRMGLAMADRGRLAALEASFDGGTVETVPLTCSGSRLHLNASARWGRIEVSVLDGDGEALRGGEATVAGKDGTDIAVPLKLQGAAISKPVKLRLELRNAQLFGFRMS